MMESFHRLYLEPLKHTLRAYARYRWGSEENIVRALEIAEAAHAGQYRDGGEPFMVHPLRVAIHFLMVYPQATPEQTVAALLHDVLEDSPEWTRYRLAELFGNAIARDVETLSKTTRDKQLSASQYKQQILRAPLHIRLIKLCDRLDNIISLRTNPDVAKVRRYLERTEEYYRDIAQDSDEKLFRTILEEIDLQRHELEAVDKSVNNSGEI
ncbi:MAG: HD domain-containing protein [Candidatus Sumerlaeaceae bacterium]